MNFLPVLHKETAQEGGEKLSQGSSKGEIENTPTDLLDSNEDPDAQV